MTNELLVQSGEYTQLYNNLSFIINKLRKEFRTVDDHNFTSLVGRAFIETIKGYNEERGKFSTLFRVVLRNRLLNYIHSLKYKGRSEKLHYLNEVIDEYGTEYQDLLVSDFNTELEVLKKMDLDKLNYIISFIDQDLRDIVLLRALGHSQSDVGGKLGLKQVYVLRYERKAYEELRFWMEDGMDAIKQYKVLVDAGMTRQEIAKHLNIKPETVSRYKERLRNYNKAINCKAVVDGERNVTHYIGELARYERKTNGLLIKGLETDEFILAHDKLKAFISEYEDALKLLS